MFCGLYIAVEAVVSLFWADNDKWMGSQAVTVSRIIIGVFMVWVSYQIS